MVLLLKFLQLMTSTHKYPSKHYQNLVINKLKFKFYKELTELKFLIMNS